MNKYGISETNCFLQCYDKDVLEWIDLDDFIDIEIDNILNVRVIKQGNRLADDDEVPDPRPPPAAHVTNAPTTPVRTPSTTSTSTFISSRQQNMYTVSNSHNCICKVCSFICYKIPFYESKFWYFTFYIYSN